MVFLPGSCQLHCVWSKESMKATIDDIPDEGIKQQLHKLQNATSSQELLELLGSDEYDFHYDLGIGQPVNNITLEDRERMISSIADHYSILVVKAELDQLLGGLALTLNVLHLICENAPRMRSLFIYSEPAPLKADDIFDLFTPKLSPVGSNRREVEEAAMILWFDFLQLIESTKGNVEAKGEQFEISLQDVLMYTTATPSQAPLGFTPKPLPVISRRHTFPKGQYMHQHLAYTMQFSILHLIHLCTTCVLEF